MECKKYNLKMDPKTHVIQLPEELVDYLGGPGTELVITGMFDCLELMTREKYNQESAIYLSEEVMAEVAQKMAELGFGE